MSISLVDNNGIIGEIATNLGYSDMIDIAEGGGFGELNQFFENGYTKKLGIVADQAIQLSRKVNRDDIRSALINLAKLLNRVEGKAIVV